MVGFGLAMGLNRTNPSYPHCRWTRPENCLLLKQFWNRNNVDSSRQLPEKEALSLSAEKTNLRLSFSMCSAWNGTGIETAKVIEARDRVRGCTDYIHLCQIAENGHLVCRIFRTGPIDYMVEAIYSSDFEIQNRGFL